MCESGTDLNWVQRTRCYMYLLHLLPVPWINRSVAFVASTCCYSWTCSCPCSYNCFSFNFLRVPVHLIHRISYSTGPTPYPCACPCNCACACACACAYYTRLPPGQLIIIPAPLPGSWLPAVVPGINPWALGHRRVPCTCSQHLHPCL
ncbi:hypothetical protein J3E69DRAFT_342387 [Trichoderma sp. SZMC 28015]